MNLLAIFLVIIGICLSFRFSDVLISLRNNYFMSVKIPGQTELNFSNVGHYKICIKIENGEDTNKLHNLNFSLVEVSNHVVIPIDNMYLTPRNFTINSTGYYTLAAEYIEGIDLSVTANIENNIFRYPLYGYPCVFLGFALFIVYKIKKEKLV